jgi:4-amino-4-deoxy-L-arabinose transferase-like glycosyltransferase
MMRPPSRRQALGFPEPVSGPVPPLHPAWVVLPAFAAGAVVWAATAAQGISTSPDSAAYVSAARSLLADGSLVRFDGVPLVEQPPLYPIVLAAWSAAFGIDPLAAARGLQIFAAGLLAIVMTALCARYASRDVTLLAATAIASAIGAPFLQVSAMAWTETIFVTMVAATLYCGLALLREPSSRRWLILLGFLAGASAVTRYAGVFVMAWAVLVTLVACRHSPVLAVGRAAGVAVLALIPIGGWALRNVAVGVAPLGPREPADETLSRATENVMNALAGWVMPDRADLPTGVAAAVVTACFVVAWRLRRDTATHSPVAMTKEQWLMLIVLPAGYLIFMVALSLRAAFDPLSNRLLVPAFPALWLVLMRWAAVAVPTVSSRALSAPAGVFLAAILGWITTAVVFDVLRMLMTDRRDGRGFSSAAWKSSALIEQVKGMPKHCALTSNNPEALYLLTGFASTSAPARMPYRSSRQLNEISQWPPGQVTCLVGFSNVRRGYLHDLSELQARATAVELARANDGLLLGVPAHRFAHAVPGAPTPTP